MATHPSADKRARQAVKRTRRNRSIDAALRTVVKKARTAIASDDREEAKAKVLAAQKALARVASKGVIRRNTAARKTSRLAKALAKSLAG